jgi:hypothetical protein
MIWNNERAGAVRLESKRERDGRRSVRWRNSFQSLRTTLECGIDRNDESHSSENDRRLYDGRGIAKRGRLRADLLFLLVVLMARRQSWIVLRLAGERHAVRHALAVEQCESDGEQDSEFERKAHRDIIAKTTHAVAVQYRRSRRIGRASCPCRTWRRNPWWEPRIQPPWVSCSLCGISPGGRGRRPACRAYP